MNLIGDVTHVASPGAFLIAEPPELGVKYYLTPESNIESGFFMPGALITTTSKTDDANCKVDTMTLSVPYEFQPDFFSGKKLIDIQVMIPSVVPLKSAKFERGTLLKRSSTKMEYSGKTADALSEFKQKIKKFKVSLSFRLDGSKDVLTRALHLNIF